ncbi:FG-GAP repeat [Mycobacterium tuberculosis]|nr:FG-GAP repeat [Mycobacterium tuberculosis]
MLGVNVALSDLNGDGQADLALGSAYRGTPGAPATGHLEWSTARTSRSTCRSSA